MLAEIDKDARDIKLLQEQVAELQKHCSTHLRCIIALEDENRTLKTQQRRDFARLLQITDHSLTNVRELQDSVRLLTNKHETLFEKHEIVLKKLKYCVQSGTDILQTGFNTAWKQCDTTRIDLELY